MKRVFALIAMSFVLATPAYGMSTGWSSLQHGEGFAVAPKQCGCNLTVKRAILKKHGHRFSLRPHADTVKRGAHVHLAVHHGAITNVGHGTLRAKIIYHF